MKILHIIPAAFDYYDDIKTEAFAIVEAEAGLGLDVEAYTLQYQGPATKEQGMPSSFEAKEPTRRYQGTVTLADVERELPQFDVVHVHAPLLGSIRKILDWKKRFPKLVLVVTVHRQSKTPDFFSVFLLLYNWIALPRLLRVADFVCTYSLSMLRAYYKRMITPVVSKIVVVDETTTFLDQPLTAYNKNTGDLHGFEVLAFKFFILYTTRVSQ